MRSRSGPSKATKALVRPIIYEPVDHDFRTSAETAAVNDAETHNPDSFENGGELG